MPEFTLKINSTKNELSVKITNDGFVGNFGVSQPQEALLRLSQVLGSFATVAATGEEEEENDEEASPVCRECGCTNDNACVDDEGNACSWAEPDLCSACEAKLEEQAEEENDEKDDDSLNEIEDFAPKKPKIKKEKAAKPAKAKPDDSEWDGYFSGKEVADKIGCTEGALSVRISTGKFPKADKKIGIKNAWEEETVNQWMYSRPRKGDVKPEPDVEEEEEIEEDDGEIENLEVESEDVAVDSRADK